MSFQNFPRGAYPRSPGLHFAPPVFQSCRRHCTQNVLDEAKLEVKGIYFKHAVLNILATRGDSTLYERCMEIIR